MTEPDDAELWRRMRDDDADAFGLLFERHGACIVGYALRRTGDAATAEDVAAVVFLEAWRRRASVDLHQSSALPWLYGVAGNTISHWRRSARRHDAALTRLASLPPRSSMLVERQVEATAESADVLEQIRRLPRRDREVLVLSVWEGLSHTEIAEALDISIGTVKSRLSRARGRLSPSRYAAATPVIEVPDPSLSTIPEPSPEPRPGPESGPAFPAPAHPSLPPTFALKES